MTAREPLPLQPALQPATSLTLATSVVRVVVVIVSSSQPRHASLLPTGSVPRRTADSVSMARFLTKDFLLQSDISIEWTVLLNH